MISSKFVQIIPSWTSVCKNSIQHCHSVFGINKLIKREEPKNYKIGLLEVDRHDAAISLLKEHYLPNHVLVKSSFMDLSDDRAIDEYIERMFKQGNSLYVSTEDGEMVGLCVNHASSAVDPDNLRNYAFYRQDPNTKEFLFFTAKLDATPNLWSIFKQPKIFEMKMLVVSPGYRRQGLAVSLAERSLALADDQGYGVTRMNCINPYDYKIAERCMLQCLAVFPIHRLRGPHAPFVKKSSDHNRMLRVYVKSAGRCRRLSEKEVFEG